VPAAKPLAINTPPRSSFVIMARGTHTRKRSRPSSSSKGRTFKRRRTARRGKRSTNFTSQSGIGGGLRFKARRTSRSAYKKHLWDSTLFKEHWRSNFAANTTMTTPASVVLQGVVSQASLRFLANPFWTAAGGTISPDSTMPIPNFIGDVIIRGGMIGLRLTNTFDTTDSFRNTLSGTVYLVRTSKNYQPAGIPSSVPIGWDPSLVADFDTLIGKIVYKKTFLLHDADSANIEYRLRTRKVDVGDYQAEFNELVWIIVGGNVDVSSARGFAISYYYNLSFAADAL